MFISSRLKNKMAQKNEEYMLLSKIQWHLYSKTPYIKPQPAQRIFTNFLGFLHIYFSINSLINYYYYYSQISRKIIYFFKLGKFLKDYLLDIGLENH